MALLRFAARDPGGANVLAGFLANQGGRFAFDVWALPRAAAVFRQAGFHPREFSEDFDATAIREAWRQKPASVLITGTSHYAAFEPLLWDIARAQGCPSLAVNDAWVNLPPRFITGKPDFVGAVDKGQIAELTALGFRQEQVLVTGHTWLAWLMIHRDRLRDETAVPARQAGVNVLFVSEAIASDVAEGVNAPFGFDEFDSFATVHRAAAKATEGGTAVNLAIKFHPYEDATTFLAKLESLPRVPNLTVLPLDRTQKPHSWILWSDLVVGIGSMLLLEAIVFGKPVVSVQPGLRREDTFIASRRGYAETLTDWNAAVPILKVLMQDRARRESLLQRNRGFLDALPPDPDAAILNWIQQRIAG